MILQDTGLTGKERATLITGSRHGNIQVCEPLCCLNRPCFVFMKIICTEPFLVYRFRMEHSMFYKYLQSKQDLTGQHRGVRGVLYQEMGLLN